MNLVYLTTVGGILKPFAFIFGIIMNAIYELMSMMSIESIAVCVIIFTIVSKMLMLPLTIKQQKSTKLSSKMNPEIQKIQEKYKGKRDEVSMRKQQEELNAVYKKYGASPMSGCLPLLISLPIMFALYRVIYAIPAYVNDIGQLYGAIADQIANIQGYGQAMLSFVAQNNIAVSALEPSIAMNSSEFTNTIVISHENLIDIMYQFKTANWDAFKDVATWTGSIDIPAVINRFGSLKDLTVEALPNAGAIDVDAFKALVGGELFTNNVAEIISINSFGNLSLLDNPGWKGIGVLIPILAAVSQFIQSKIAMAANKQATDNVDNPAASSMKMMNYMMPLMSMFFCAMLPICIGLYWITSSVVGIFQTIFINKYIDKINIDDMVAENEAKIAKKNEKLGINTGSKMAEVAKTSTKNIQTEEKQFRNAYDYKNNASSNKGNKSSRNSRNEYKRSTISYSASSIAANANLIRNNMEAEENAEAEATQETKTEE